MLRLGLPGLRTRLARAEKRPGGLGREGDPGGPLVALQCRSARRMLGSRCSTRRRARGACFAPRAPTPGWRGSAARRWASSGTRVPLVGGWEGGGRRSDRCPAQGVGLLGAGRADGGRQWHVGLLLRGRGEAAACPEVARGPLRVVRRAAGRWGARRRPHHPWAPTLPRVPSLRLNWPLFCLCVFIPIPPTATVPEAISWLPAAKVRPQNSEPSSETPCPYVAGPWPIRYPQAGLMLLDPPRMELCPLRLPQGGGSTSPQTPKVGPCPPRSPQMGLCLLGQTPSP